MTRLLLDAHDAAQFDLALCAVILAAAQLPTPRHSVRAGRRDVRAVCAELDAGTVARRGQHAANTS